MQRRDAMMLVASVGTAQVPASRREAAIADHWNDDDLGGIEDDLRAEMRDTEEPRYPPTDRRYDPLVAAALARALEGVTNAYLAQQLASHHLGNGEDVVGDFAPMDPCACCGYRAIDASAGWDICPVCFWEDDGTPSDDAVSPANRMTLGEGKAAYARCGACAERFVPLVVDGTSRYPR